MDVEHCLSGKYCCKVGSILSSQSLQLRFTSAQSRELQAQLAGQIARALAVFCVDEVVIFDDGDFRPPPSDKGQDDSANHEKYTGYTDPNYFLAHLLSYLECPPYLRRALFQRHPDLQHAGMLPSLDMPHHIKATKSFEYREGVTTDGSVSDAEGKTLVDIGMRDPVHVPSRIPANTRVTLKFEPEAETYEPVAPTAPKEDKGWYWGYSVRVAKSMSAVMTESPYDGGYDLTFGTSERGRPVSEVTSEDSVPAFQHMMLVLGGVAGLEVAVKADEELKKLNVESPESLFDYWVNLLPGQGSRTIRTEEAIWLGLMTLKGVAQLKGQNPSSS